MVLDIKSSYLCTEIPANPIHRRW